VTQLRADAARNRKLIIDAAASEFAEHGTSASISRIAARAGTGKGTVFRHFPTKVDLFLAIFVDQLDRLADTGEALLGSDDAEAALLKFMSVSVELQVRDRAFCQIAAERRGDPRVRTAADRFTRAAEALTAAARHAGAVRDDITGTDVVLLINAASQATTPLEGVLPGLWHRYLGLVFDGLSPAGARPLPVPAPLPEHFESSGARPEERVPDP
jgi:AcrR family transcriptional regulator